MLGLSEKLKMARNSVGITQSQAAKSLGISRSKLIQLENQCGNIDIVLLHKLSDLYGYSLAYFIVEGSIENESTAFAFRAGELPLNDLDIPAWGRRVLRNMRQLNKICREAGI